MSEEDEENEKENEEETQEDSIEPDVIARNQQLLEQHREDQRQEIAQQLLEDLPQGEGSTLDADTVDGLHAEEIVLEALKECAKQVRYGGGGGGGGMKSHGNEMHTIPFATKCCQICDVDVLPEDSHPGHAVLLTTDSGIYVCTEGTGELACGGCTFKNVAALPSTTELGEGVFLLTDTHVYIGV